MEREVFGPVLHVATFDADEIDASSPHINRKGYGLTFGLHTRIEARVQEIVDGIHAGNIYVNRNQIGAVVGSQPFGGEGLSGTGPKAGGPHYLRRFRRAAEAGTHRCRGPQGDGDRARRQSAGPGAWRLVDAARPHRHPAQASARQGCGGDRGCRRHRFRPGRPARADRRGQHADAGRRAGGCCASAPTPTRCCAQAVQALAAGNAVLAVAPGAPAALAALTGKGLPIAAIDGRPDPVEARSLGIDVVAFSGTPEAVRVVRKVLAERNGPIVPLVTEVLYPAAYAHERAVCVDTTAAGGNASLLAGA